MSSIIRCKSQLWKSGKIGIVGTVLIFSFLLASFGSFSGTAPLQDRDENPWAAAVISYTPTPLAEFRSVVAIFPYEYAMGSISDFSAMQAHDELSATLTAEPVDANWMFSKILQISSEGFEDHPIKMLCVDYLYDSYTNYPLQISVSSDPDHPEFGPFLGDAINNGENWFDVTDYVTGPTFYVHFSWGYPAPFQYLVDYICLCMDHVLTPTVDAPPDDITYRMDDFDTTVSWAITDVETAETAHYEVRIDGDIVQSGNFDPDSQGHFGVTLENPPQEIGTHECTLHVDDGYNGLLLVDTVQVTVQDGKLTDLFDSEGVISSIDAACYDPIAAGYWHIDNPTGSLALAEGGALTTGGCFQITSSSDNWVSISRTFSPAASSGQDNFLPVRSFFRAIRGKNLAFEFMFKSQLSFRAKAIIGYQCGEGPIQYTEGNFLTFETGMLWEIVEVSAFIPMSATSITLKILIKNDGAPVSGYVDDIRLSLLRSSQGPSNTTAPVLKTCYVADDHYQVPAGERVGSGGMAIQVLDAHYDGTALSTACFSVGLSSWGYDMPTQSGTAGPWSQTCPYITRLKVEFINHPSSSSPSLWMESCGQSNEKGRIMDPAQLQGMINDINTWGLNVAGWAIGIGAGLLGSAISQNPAVGIAIGTGVNILWDSIKYFFIEDNLAESTAVYRSLATPSSPPCFVEWRAPKGLDNPLYFRDLTSFCNFQLTLPAEGQYTLKMTAELNYGACQDLLQSNLVHIDNGWYSVGSQVLTDYLTFIVGDEEKANTPPLINSPPADIAYFDFQPAPVVSWVINDNIGIGDAASWYVTKDETVVSSGIFNFDGQVVDVLASQTNLNPHIYKLYADDGYTGPRLLDTVQVTMVDDDPNAPVVTYLNWFQIGPWHWKCWFQISDYSDIHDAFVLWHRWGTGDYIWLPLTYEPAYRWFFSDLWWADGCPSYVSVHDNDNDRTGDELTTMQIIFGFS